MKDEVRLNVKMPNELLQQIKSLANTKNISVSAFVRLLLINYLEQTKDDNNRKNNIN